ncbi:hypothetical protein K7W42_22605 [Deinococcus sp. HMF7604]|uniref:hypothetical protein n=1 Tax=Deinococcus betulae TaxID=2873312 RepID=UPI001CC92BB1|nr:hypothetical protein [Deinococcus betulae]MBZ9753618.1 hypothetical protein [Deinococcus betulae]
MTPPDWLLQGLGGGAVLVLLLLLRPFLRRTPRRAKAPRQPVLDEWEARRLGHEHDVLRPGLLHAPFDRDSVSMGDDAADHWRLLMFEDDLPISTVLGPPIYKVLPSIAGGQATWLVQLHEPLTDSIPPGAGNVRRAEQLRIIDVALVAQQWAAPRLLGPDFSVSRIGKGLLYAQYLGQQDPDELSHSAHPAVTSGIQSAPRRWTYDPAQIPAEQRVMIRLPSTP